MPKKPPSTENLVRNSLEFEYFHPQKDDNGDTPIPVTFIPGCRSKLVLAVGDNASGKSLYRRIIQLVCKEKGIECIHLSMEGRRSAIYSGFIYGSENYHSTGQNSAYTVIKALETSKLREKPHVIFWDEPDFGLSERWAESMGIEISRGLNDPNPNLVAAFLVTHSRALLKPLIDDESPHALIFDPNAPTSLQEYLARPVEIQPLSLLKELSRQRFQKIQKVQNRAKDSR